MKQTDYFFNENVTIHEGLSTGAITSASMFFTKEHIYIIPANSHQVLGTLHTLTDFTNSADFINDLVGKIETLSADNLHKTMQSFLPEDYIYDIVSLKKFTINTGWLTAGIRLKKQGGKLKTINIRPRAQLKQLKAFYNL